jgi:hypothetical protein
MNGASSKPGAHGEPLMRWCKIEYVGLMSEHVITSWGRNADVGIQGYELAEEEVKISLDAFRAQYTSIDGTVA